MNKLLRQALATLFVIWLAVTLAFVGLRVLPGDAIETQFAEAANPAAAQLKRDALGLDDPLPVQYFRYLTGLLRGDFGVSLYSGLTVTEIIAQRLPPTLELALWSMAIATICGISAGVVGGLSWGWCATAAHLLVNLMFSIPIYWTATFVLFIIGVRLGGVQGQVVLPALVVGLHTSAAIARVVRTEIYEAARQDFVRTARSKGLSETTVIGRHILRVGLIPVFTVITLQTGVLLSGAVITESIFQRPGLGLLLLDAVIARDYPVVQGVVILLAMVYLILNGLADYITRWLDPRVTA